MPVEGPEAPLFALEVCWKFQFLFFVVYVFFWGDSF